MPQSDALGAPDSQKPAAYFGEALNDAERLLKYAAEIGVDVDPDTRSAILQARTAYTYGRWDDHIGASLLTALTQLAGRLNPVTAESLEAYQVKTRPTVRKYSLWAIILACIILPFSFATFITSAVSNELRDDITQNNALAIKLEAELGPTATDPWKQPPTPQAELGPTAADPWMALPPNVSRTDVITDLVEYAAAVRAIYARGRMLNYFIFWRRNYSENTGTSGQPNARFELQVPIIDPDEERDNMTRSYQNVRYFAQMAITDVSVFYGAFSSVILPVLYALLGTCAYLIRSFEDQMNRRTFTPSAATNSARLLIAGIGGLVVGLFSNSTLLTQQASLLPPLGLAFLIGYAVDVFFAFLEGLLKTFTRSPQTLPLPAPPPPRSPIAQDMHPQPPT